MKRLAILSALLVAVLWGGNITAVYPVIKVAFQGESLQDWVVAEIAYLRHNELPEGKLTDLRKSVVNATALDARLLDLSIRSGDLIPAKNFDLSKAGLVQGLLIGLLLSLLLLSFGAWIIVRRKRRNKAMPADPAAGDRQAEPEMGAATVTLPCSACGKNLKVKAEAGRTTIDQGKAVTTESGNPYNAFVQQARAKLGHDPSRITLAQVTLTLGATSTGVTSLEEVLGGDAQIAAIANAIAMR